MPSYPGPILTCPLCLFACGATRSCGRCSASPYVSFFSFCLFFLCTSRGKVESLETVFGLVDEDVRPTVESPSAGLQSPVFLFFFLSFLTPPPPSTPPFSPVAAIIWLSDGGGLDRGPSPRTQPYIRCHAAAEPSSLQPRPATHIFTMVNDTAAR